MEPYTFTINDSSLVCEGNGISFLRLKSQLAGRLGSENIRTLNAKSFSVPVQIAITASDVFIEACGFLPEELSIGTRAYETHAEARENAMQNVEQGLSSHLEAPWPEILDPAQSIAVSAMVTPGLAGLCLFDEQGIGKTVTTIAAFDVLLQRGEVDSLIVVSPVTMMEAWEREINQFLPKKYKIVIADGNITAKRKAILSSFDVLVCNFESIPSLLVPLKGILSSRKAVLAIDESFNVKNSEALRSAAIRDLRQNCVRGFVMCGTPAPNSSIDVINQFDIADNGYTFAGYKPPKDDDLRSEEIMQRIEQRGTYVRRLKEEVLPNLPNKNFHVVSVNMSGKQAALYEEARGKLEVNLKSMDNVTFKKSLATYFQQRSTLLQICACPEAIDPTYTDTSAKIEALDKLVRDVVEDGKRKLIIWSFYKNSLQSIFKRYSEYSPVLLDGSSTASERASAVASFQNNPEVMICVANPAAAGAGVTLHTASDAAYISFSNQAAHFLQSLDRIHRRGQKADSTDYYLFVCKGTIEEGEVQRLREKEVRQNRLLGDNVKWPNSLDEALAELST